MLCAGHPAPAVNSSQHPARALGWWCDHLVSPTMPKLKNHHFTTTAADGQSFSFQSDVHVSAEGEFSCTVPDYLVPNLKVIGSQLLPAGSHYQGQLKVNHRAYAPTLASLMSYVDSAHADFYKVETQEDFVIGYDWYAEVSYYIRPDGSICENGAAPGAQHGAGGQWAVHKNRTGGSINGSMGQIDHYAVGLFAAVFRRTTYRRASGETVKLERIYSASDLPKGIDWAHRLQGIVSLSTPQKPERLRYLPLTNDSARFFFETMMSMCEIGRRFANFFGDEANVHAAIAGQGPSLLAAPPAALERQQAQ